jgi:hypothetical protein
VLVLEERGYAREHKQVKVRKTRLGHEDEEDEGESKSNGIMGIRPEVKNVTTTTPLSASNKAHTLSDLSLGGGCAEVPSTPLVHKSQGVAL